MLIQACVRTTDEAKNVSNAERSRSRHDSKRVLTSVRATLPSASKAKIRSTPLPSTSMSGCKSEPAPRSSSSPSSPSTTSTSATEDVHSERESSGEDETLAWDQLDSESGASDDVGCDNFIAGLVSGSSQSLPASRGGAVHGNARQPNSSRSLSVRGKMVRFLEPTPDMASPSTTGSKSSSTSKSSKTAKSKPRTSAMRARGGDEALLTPSDTPAAAAATIEDDDGGARKQRRRRSKLWWTKKEQRQIFLDIQVLMIKAAQSHPALQVRPFRVLFDPSIPSDTKSRIAKEFFKQPEEMRGLETLLDPSIIQHRKKYIQQVLSAQSKIPKVLEPVHRATLLSKYSQKLSNTARTWARLLGLHDAILQEHRKREARHSDVRQQP